MHPPLIINGIDFNKRLDEAKEILFMRLEDKWTAREVVDIFFRTNMLIRRLSMKIAQPKHPFIITDNDKQA